MGARLSTSVSSARGDAIRALGSPTVLALTATAPQAVVDDISEQLALLDELRVVNLGLFRQNLQFTVEPTTSDAEKTQTVLDLLSTRPGPTIIYAATVRHVNALAEALTRAGHDVARYHGALGPRRRLEAQDRFMSGETAVMVATNAFGMGIDKPDIRLVVHYDLPGPLDAYYQEAGRAGRDEPSPVRCCSIQHADRRLQKFFVAGRFPTTEQFVAVADALKTATRADLDLTIEDLMASTKLSANKVQVIVDVMKAARAVRATRGAGFRLRRELVRAAVVSMAETYDAKARHDCDKLQRMVSYAQTALCRWKLVLESLDEPPSWSACGLCDNCQGTASLASGVAERRVTSLRVARSPRRVSSPGPRAHRNGARRPMPSDTRADVSDAPAVSSRAFQGFAAAPSSSIFSTNLTWSERCSGDRRIHRISQADRDCRRKSGTRRSE